MRNYLTLEHLLAHLRVPLYQNSYVLIMMRVVTTFFGFLFWALAARMMPTEDVGLASGALSATMLLSGFAQLGLGYGLVRYRSRSEAPNKLISLFLIIIGLVSLALAIVFVAGLEFWSPALTPLKSDPLNISLFIMLVVSWGLSVLLHWVFVATRRSILSFMRQTSHMLIAVLLLLALLPFLPGFTAALMAHSLATLASVILSFQVLPKAQAGFRFQWNVKDAFKGASLSQFARFSSTNYVTEIIQRIPNTALPLIVINLLSPRDGAFFFVIWNIASALPHWIGGLSQSLFAEGSNDPKKASGYARNSIFLGLLLTVGVVVCLIIAGEFILSIYGQEYVENGLHLMYLVTVAAIPAVLISLLVSYLRIQERLQAMFVISSGGSIMGVLAIFLGVKQLGLIGAGVGWLVSECLLLSAAAIWWFVRKSVSK